MIWSAFGQLVDAVLGGVVAVWGGGAPPGFRSGPGGGGRWSGRSGESRGAGDGSVFPPVPARTAAGGVAAPLDRDLRGDDSKLVSYAIVSLRPCAEEILPGGSGAVLVTTSMTAETFATYVVACYVQSPGHPPIPQATKKYLRVAYEVLARWPLEPLCCEERSVAALHGIRDALQALPERCAPAEPVEDPIGRSDPQAELPP